MSILCDDCGKRMTPIEYMLLAFKAVLIPKVWFRKRVWTINYNHCEGCMKK